MVARKGIDGRVPWTTSTPSQKSFMNPRVGIISHFIIIPFFISGVSDYSNINHTIVFNSDSSITDPECIDIITFVDRFVESPEIFRVVMTSLNDPAVFIMEPYSNITILDSTSE